MLLDLLASLPPGTADGRGRDAVLHGVVLASPADPANSLELEVNTFAVVLPACPDWSRDPAFDGRNLGLSNIGCANATNLGLMVADPGDLRQGRSFGPADGVREAEAVMRYRQARRCGRGARPAAACN